jgi:hypothetical protein
LLFVILIFLNALKKSENRNPNLFDRGNNRDNRVDREENNQDVSFNRWNRIEENADEELPAGFQYAEPILQDLYYRKRINEAEFNHYNRFNPRDLGQILIDDRVCSEYDLPMDLRRYLSNDNDE